MLPLRYPAEIEPARSLASGPANQIPEQRVARGDLEVIHSGRTGYGVLSDFAVDDPQANASTDSGPVGSVRWSTAIRDRFGAAADILISEVQSSCCDSPPVRRSASSPSSCSRGASSTVSAVVTITGYLAMFRTPCRAFL